MPGIVVVGAQWGDEGKGKIVDYLAENADCVVRYQGGANAGHTVVIGEETFKFHLIPSGVIRGKRIFIGNGVVVDPETLISELNTLKEKGINPDITISGRAHVVFDFNKIIDGMEEEAKGRLAAGTTKRAIGPTYSDKSARYGIQMVDLLDEEIFKEKFNKLVAMKQKIINDVYGSDIKLDREELTIKYLEFGKLLRDLIGDVSFEINKLLDDAKTVIFEGAQGTMLDVDHGLYPYGTSSNPIAGGACVGVGVGPTKMNEIIGVAKAYTTRVGAGPVPTELESKIADDIREKGKEYGTTTGRPRRVGWLDTVTLRYAVRLSGITSWAVTKLDVLGGVDPIKICIAYEFNRKRLTEQPLSLSIFEKCKPEYIFMRGWDDLPRGEWRSVAENGFYALPKEARKYIKKIEDFTGVPVKIVSIGPIRDETISVM